MATENMRATISQADQWTVQNQVFGLYDLILSLSPHAKSVHFEIRRDDHMKYLTNSIRHLKSNFSVLDANRPWICYWIMQSLAVLGDCVDDKLENDVIDFLDHCQDKDGGFGGGPSQMPHLATTYAAVMTLINVGGERSLSTINRETVYAFLLSMKDKSGGFRMHDGGEIDVRACYTAIAVASILNILDDLLIQNLGDYILSCQTYEGGISGEPGTEAHGGYTYCGVAAMVLINEVNRLDLPSLVNWLVFRQGIEGGFQGRTNKLVDGCYSYWQGAVAAIIQRLNVSVSEQLGMPNIVEDHYSSDIENDSTNTDLSEDAVNDISEPEQEGEPGDPIPISTGNIAYNFIRRSIGMRPLTHSIALQRYILLCTQDNAGFRDKPGKSRDHYHTCYVLSGMSVCQHGGAKQTNCPPLPRDVLGPYANLLEPVHPLYGVVIDKYYEAHRFFGGL